ncbi:MAG: hypothetical protein A2579_06030 [Lysobacterales bacterium RIFOXYD1_FULL_69_11]|nr:MAG: hypothetical protein A2190_12130 [Xanthomonadales bacterium RIFOXYA1_FULL_69_10]OHE87457.1 MAG: hypothetical protein A2579_06030 [Xanthomonadales bacterium RIFOXYD1_FULL_69_11]
MINDNDTRGTPQAAPPSRTGTRTREPRGETRVSAPGALSGGRNDKGMKDHKDDKVQAPTGGASSRS